MNGARIAAVSILGLSALTVATVLACGPFFPEDALDKPRGILQPPLFHFTSELYLVPLPQGADIQSSAKPGTPAFTLDLEMQEMEGLAESMFPTADERQQWLGSYRQLRRAMIYGGDQSDQKMQPVDSTAAQPWTQAKDSLESVITPLPEDIQLYIRGAAARLDAVGLAVGDPDKEAREIWQRLLKLPPERRQWRSTWAAWMLFRITPPADHDQQGRWLNETRKLSKAGFKDCLHLGIEATHILGRPASDLPHHEEVSAAEWRRSSMLRAALGHSRAEADVKSDRWTHEAWTAEFAGEILADPYLRKVQLLHLVEVAQNTVGWQFGVQYRGNSTPNDDLTHWLDSFEQAAIKDQKETTLIAWIYYNAAKFEEARRWIQMAPNDDVTALALRGKLAAQHGNRKESLRFLKQMGKQLPNATDLARSDYESEQLQSNGALTHENYPKVKRHLLLADLGVAQVANNDFAGALQTFLKTDFWRDSAFVAERLLSAEELLALSRSGKLPSLKKMQNHQAKDQPQRSITVQSLEDAYFSWDFQADIDRFTYLVGRRLAREGFYKNATEILPDDLSLAVKRYQQEVQKGNNKQVPEAERAEAYWTAAQLARQLGMEIFGFEGAPDQAIYGGSFARDDLADLRSHALWYPAWEEGSTEEARTAARTPIFPATDDEKWRTRRYRAAYNHRFHYRFTAADLAWKAAHILPRNAPESAEILCIAGSWLKNKVPKEADRFYKALVRRNPNVPLAQEADKRHWFPEVAWSFDLSLE